MAYAGGRLLRERFEGTERLVPLAIALRASALLPLAVYAAAVGISPTEAIHEAVGLWCQREERRRARHVRAEAQAMLRRAEHWDPIGDLIRLDELQRGFSSDPAPLPIDHVCRPFGTSRGNAIGGRKKTEIASVSR
jgi:hypothetical protein